MKNGYVYKRDVGKCGERKLRTCKKSNRCDKWNESKNSRVFGAEDVNDVVFTSSATEAANRVLLGYDFKENMTVYVSPYEHNAVMRTLEAVRKRQAFK